MSDTQSIRELVENLRASSYNLEIQLNHYSCPECSQLRQQLMEKDAIIQSLSDERRSTYISVGHQQEIDSNFMNLHQQIQQWKGKFEETVERLHIMESQLAVYKCDYDEEKESHEKTKRLLRQAKSQAEQNKTYAIDLLKAEMKITELQGAIQALHDERLAVGLQYGNQFHNNQVYMRRMVAVGSNIDETDMVGDSQAPAAAAASTGYANNRNHSSPLRDMADCVLQRNVATVDLSRRRSPSPGEGLMDLREESSPPSSRNHSPRS